MTWGSTAPAAMTALAAGFTSALAPTLVVNGQRVSSELPAEAVTVGYRDEATPAVEGQFTAEGYAVSPSRETYTVNCAAIVVTGEDDYLPSRLRVFALLGLVGAYLAANPTLGVGMSARLSAWSLDETLAPTATVITLIFGVDIDAFTTT